jgi:hypothetical protein
VTPLFDAAFWGWLGVAFMLSNTVAMTRREATSNHC